MGTRGYVAVHQHSTHKAVDGCYFLTPSQPKAGSKCAHLLRQEHGVEKHREDIYYQAINYEGGVWRTQQSRFGPLPFLFVFLGSYPEFLI